MCCAENRRCESSRVTSLKAKFLLLVVRHWCVAEKITSGNHIRCLRSRCSREYGYVSTEVHLSLITHKRTVMPHDKNRSLRKKNYFFSSPRFAPRAKCGVRLAWLIKLLLCRLQKVVLVWVSQPLWPCDKCISSSNGWSLLQILWRLLGWSVLGNYFLFTRQRIGHRRYRTRKLLFTILM